MRSVSHLFAATIFAGALVGCGAGAQPGVVQLGLVGADQVSLFSLTPDHTLFADVVSAVVTIDEIDGRVGGAWAPLVTSPQTVDLLKLDNQTLTALGIVKLPAGKIEALRFKLDDVGDYVVLKSGDKQPLEVPDHGYVAVVGKLDLDACASGIVILDFDPKIKIELEGGNKKEYELSCVAHVKTEELKNACGAGADGGAAGDLAQGGDLAGSCNGVVCAVGDVCVSGVCVADPCANVVCPGGQICELQGGQPVCVADPCANIVCPSGQQCTSGVCVPTTTPPPTTPDGGCHHH
jgi:hypothetical protein